MKILLFILASSLLFMACEQPKQTEFTHYNMDSLLHAQIELLVKEQAVLTKDASIADEHEVKTITPKDTVAWQRELDIFQEISTINKPINYPLYSASLGEGDTSSNLLINSYYTQEDLPVKSFRLFYLTNPSRIRRLEAIVRETNSLLSSERLLVMEFEEIYNKIVLKSYSIVGGQKMFLGDSVKFSVKGSIKLP